MSFDPNEERDDQGRWTAGHASGAHMEAHDQQNFGAVESIAENVAEVASVLGFDAARIHISDETRTFELNGRTCIYGGAAYTRGDGDGYKKGEIVIYALHAGSTGTGTAVHEIEHQKYQAFLEDLREEKARMEADPDYNKETRWVPDETGTSNVTSDGKPVRRELGFMRPDGTLNEPYASRYPMYQAHEAIVGGNWSKMAAEDGCTDYSREYWAGSGHTTESAFHETLAEMSRLRYEHGQSREYWKDQLAGNEQELKQLNLPDAEKGFSNSQIFQDYKLATEKMIFELKTRLGIKTDPPPVTPYMRFLQDKVERYSRFPGSPELEDTKAKLAARLALQEAWIESLRKEAKQAKLLGPVEIGKSGKPTAKPSETWNALYKMVEANWKAKHWREPV